MSDQATPQSASGFTGKEFRQTVGAFATGVTVVTTMGDGENGYGMTVNSFASVSLDPPLVLVCAISGTAGSEEIQRNGCFAVNILAMDQQPLSNFFASRDRPRGRDAFRDVPHTVGQSGAPLIEGVAAHLDCIVDQRHLMGDHEVFVGEVLDIHVDPDAQPLLFHGGRYRFLGEDPA